MKQPIKTEYVKVRTVMKQAIHFQSLTIPTFRTTECHDKGTVALVQFSETGTASMISDNRQFFED